MRNNKKKYNQESIVFNKKIQYIALIATAIVVFLFIGALAYLNALPFKYLVMIIIVILILLVISAYLLCCNHKTKLRKGIGFFLSLILIVTMLIGNFYLFSTYNMLSKISSNAGQTEDFYVVVLKSSDYNSIEDIKNKEVFVLKDSSDSSAYREAKAELMNKVDVTLTVDDDYVALGNELVDEQQNETDKIIFISNTNYEILCEEISEYEDLTKIIYTISIDIENKETTKAVNVTEEPFNVYISGIDTYGSIDKVSRSDVNMIMSINPSTKEILLTSIPRDMYVTLHSYGQLDKLTHSGIYGIDETVTTVEDWLDVDLNYYIRVNFTSVEDIIDAIGGVDVNSPVAFNSTVSKYSYVEGTNHLTGEAALFFARERHAFSDGDNSRIKNQQRVIKGIIEKVTSSTSILTGYTKILNTIGDKAQTDLSSGDLAELVKMQLNDLGGWTIKSQSITGTGTYASTYSMGSRQLYVVIPNEESVKNAKAAIDTLMSK